MSSARTLRRRGMVATALAGAVLATSAVSAQAAPLPAPCASSASSFHADRIRQEVLRLTMLPFNRASLHAVNRVVAPNFVQHDVRIADGRTALKSWIGTYRRTNPDAKISVKRVLVDGDLVLVHSNVIATPGTLGDAAFDIYRVSRGRIVEHWNTTQAVPTSTTSGNDMFSTISSPQRLSPDPRVKTAATKVIAAELYKIGGIDTKDELSQAPYYQHSTGLPNGTAAIQGIYQLFPDLKVNIKRVIVQNDYIAFHNEYIFSAAIPPMNVVDMWRVQNGKLVEHWDVIEAVPATSANNNGAF